MKKLQLSFFVLSLVLLNSCTKNEPLAQWRGPDRNGIYPESGLMDTWPGEGLELLWVYEGLGRGYASPAISEKGLYINGEQDGASFTVALDSLGNKKWQSPNGEEFLGEGFSSTYPGSRSTPTVKGDLVYSTSGTGYLSCFDASSGELKWSHDLINDWGGQLGYFGFSESVAVDDKKVYCTPGGQENNMVAFDRFTGELIWSAELLKDTFAYGSPVLLELPEAYVILATFRHYMLTVDASDGSLLAKYELEGYEYDGEHCNTPVYIDGSVYFVANDVPGQGAMRLELSPDGKEFNEIWRNNEVLNNFGGFVVVDGRIATLLKGNKLVLLDHETGTISDSLKVGNGSLIFADDKFITYAYSGNLSLINYKDGKLQAAGVHRVKKGSGHHFSHPVVHNGVLYIRRGDSLMAYRIK